MFKYNHALLLQKKRKFVIFEHKLCCTLLSICVLLINRKYDINKVVRVNACSGTSEADCTRKRLSLPARDTGRDSPSSMCRLQAQGAYTLEWPYMFTRIRHHHHFVETFHQ